jgi:hypothetical protein
LYLDAAIKLRRQTLQNAGALVPGRKTFWQWGVAAGLSIEVTGHAGAFEIVDPDGIVLRVVLTKKLMVCPHCGCHCHKLVHNGEGWGCRRCCNLKYRSRAWPHPTITLRSLLRRLSRVDGGSLREEELRRKLERINSTIAKQARRVGYRCTRPPRG